MQAWTQTPRHWGWHSWFEENFLPRAAPGADAGTRDPQVWIVSGPEESGRNDLLEVLHEVLQTDSYPCDVEWLAREPGETALEWQSRAAMVLGNRRFALAGQVGAGTSRIGVSADPRHNWDGRRAFFFLRDGDAMPVTWWRQQMPRWLAAAPDGCLVVTVSHANESIAEAFRHAGGGGQGIHYRTLGPWEPPMIEAWRKEFLPHDQRSTEDLRKYARGGWPGLLWNLFDERQKATSGPFALQQIQRTLERMPNAERQLLLAASRAPAPARDYAEILLRREVPFTVWRSAFLHWEDTGLLHRDHGWEATNLPQVIGEMCATLGDDLSALAVELVEPLQIVHRFMPLEEHRRLVQPAARFQHVEREVLETLWGERGRRIWDTFLETEVLQVGAGPRAFVKGFLAALRTYAQSLPGAKPFPPEDRLKTLWEKRRENIRAEIAKLSEKRTGLERRVEDCRSTIQRQEKSLRRLRKRGGRLPRQASTPTEKPSRDRSWRWVGGITIVGGVGWIYLSYLQGQSFNLYPTLGGLLLIGIGSAAAAGGRDEPRTSRKPIPESPSAAAARIAQAEQNLRAQQRLVRDTHDECYREAGRLAHQVKLLEESLNRPYARG